MTDKKIDASNPFNKGVTYDMFLESLGKQKLETFLKDKCSDDEINWIKKELEEYKKNKK